MKLCLRQNSLDVTLSCISRHNVAERPLVVAVHELCMVEESLQRLLFNLCLQKKVGSARVFWARVWFAISYQIAEPESLWVPTLCTPVS